MAPNFSKNAILMGPVDYFCLVCEAYFKSTRETYLHISESGHKENLKTTQFVEDYEEDYIRKINKKYFCELCNKLLTVLAKVRLHVTETTHLLNKNNATFKRIDNNVVAFNRFAINDNAWHGLYEKHSCAVCNTEYDNEEEHKNISTHILNLIQAKVESDKNYNVYRKVDDDSFYCITCNMMVCDTAPSTHFTETEHKKKYQECCNAMKSMVIKEANVEITDTENNKPLIDNVFKSSKKTDEAKPPLLSRPIIDKNTMVTATNLENNKNGIDKENCQKAKSNYVYDDKSEERICEVLGTDNYITRDENGKPWCILCDWVMDVNNIERHVGDQHHKTIVKLHKKRLHKLKTENSKTVSKPKEIVKVAETPKKNDDKILESVSEYQKNGININFELNLAVCKKCSKDIPFDVDAIEIHIKEHKTKPNKEKEATATLPFKSGEENVVDRKTALISSPVLLKNGESKSETLPVSVNKENSKTAASNTTQFKNEEVKSDNTINNVTVPNKDTNNNKKQIVNGQLLSVKSKKAKEISLKKLPIRQFITNMTAVSNLLYKDIVVNDKYCINFFSLAFLENIGRDRLNCFACNETLSLNAMEQHCAKPRHENAMNETPVVLEIDSEFIREHRPGLFHCGFCNTEASSWDEMLKHLNSYSHKESKNGADIRLERYRQEIARDQFQRHMQDSIMMNLMMQRFS